MSSRLRVALAAAALCALALPALASAHIERPSYWPDPRPDHSVSPPAGAAVPKPRPLASALDDGARGETRVVCKPDSLSLLVESVRKARKHGYDIRPTDHRTLSAREGRRLIRINRALDRRCEYREIQPAVNDSGNNDRVVVMPGLYTEPTSRSQPDHDPACDKYEINNEFGDPGALSYEYQFHCPNDQNLIAVLGRKPGKGEDPDPPRWNRHEIPNLGPCIRCNFQIEGSGVSADDVVIEAGDESAGNGGPSGVGAVKDVGVRADRADGFVLRNLTVRHAGEHGIYVIETDGYRLDRFKAYYSRLYGVLTFVPDHGLMQNCEGVGHGDSALYPGAATETGEQRISGQFRYNQEIRKCDMHHNTDGYSGTNGNAVHFHHNDIYDNAIGLTTDVLTSPGHPGFPQDSALIERNNFYSNNFNIYEPDSDVIPALPIPVGVGMWIAGGNNNVVRHNRFWDNWRRGVMLAGFPDAVICGPVRDSQQAGCNVGQISTSYRNRFYGNVMGIEPGGKVSPNGVDFWWDSFPTNTRNCWYANRGPDGEVTSEPSPPLLPDCNGGQNPSSSGGIGNLVAEAEMVNCLGVQALSSEALGQGYDFETGGLTCSWFTTPPQPGSAAARRAAQDAELRADLRQSFVDFCDSQPVPLCEPFDSVR